MIHRELQVPGRWDLRLKDSTPDTVRDLVVERGHVVFLEEYVDVRRLDDTFLLANSIYTGRLLRKVQGVGGESPMQLSGDHITSWLGDTDGRGEIITSLKSYDAATWSNFMTDILPASLTAGSFTDNPGTVSAEYFATTPKAAIDHAAEIAGAEYRVNDDGSVDSGVVADLYVTSPTAVMVRKGTGFDPTLTVRSSPSLETAIDAQRWVSELHLLGTVDAPAGRVEGIMGTADLDDIAKSNPYKDLQGNADPTAIVVNDPVTFVDLADTRAQTLLGPASDLVESITLDVADFDIDADFNVGDTIYVYDPPLLIDESVSLRYGGGYVSPKTIRVFGISWPVKDNMGVYYRDLDGAYTDLSSFYEPEGGTTQIIVGDRYRSPFDRTGGLAGSLQQAVNLPSNVTTVPGQPTHLIPWLTRSYQSASGDTKAAIRIEWSVPTNTDGSTIVDGSHYVVRYREVS